MWFVYVIRCADGTFYTGVTTDPGRRLAEHNAGLGGAYTRAKRPVRFIFKEAHPSRSSAFKREAEIKQWPRKKKEALGLLRAELFARLNASAERMLWALQRAYEVGTQAGISDQEEDQLLESLQRAKRFKETARAITQELSGKASNQR